MPPWSLAVLSNWQQGWMDSEGWGKARQEHESFEQLALVVERSYP